MDKKLELKLRKLERRELKQFGSVGGFLRQILMFLSAYLGCYT